MSHRVSKKQRIKARDATPTIIRRRSDPLTFEDCALIVLGSFIAAMAVFGIFYSLYVMVKK